MMAAMIERLRHLAWCCAAVLSAACCAARMAAQEKATPPVQDVAAMEQRAKDVEQRVVEQYGSPAQQYAFAHPHTVPPGVKRPKFPKNPQGPEDMREVMDYAVYSMEPEQIFDTVFQLGLYERYLKGAFAGETAAERAKQRAIELSATAANQASQALAFVPGGALAQPIVSAVIQSTARRALENERASEEERQAAAEGLALTAGLNVFLKDHLSAEEMASYTAADARTKAARLLQLTDTMLERQGVPSAYVIQLTAQLAGTSGAGAVLAQMGAVFGDARFAEANWRGLGRAGQWQALTDALHRMLQEGQASMADPQHAKAFLAKVQFPADRSGSSAVLGTFGPEALPRYRKASAEEKRAMELDARVIHAASEFLARISMGDAADVTR